MDCEFYRTFEDRFRGTRGLIKMRFAVYLPFVESLKAESNRKLLATDLGCGRGEWLEFLVDLGFDARGVDSDLGMLSDCHKHGLSVSHGDALEHLKRLPSSSQSIVSAFHMVEHIPFETLTSIVQEAFRVLQPGGLFILETPNAENISVATRYFYLDPTHTKPVPAELLSFVCEYYGFNRIKKLGLQENKYLIDKVDITMREVIVGASPDYALVCQKNSEKLDSSLLEDAFNEEYGLSIDNLFEKHEARFRTMEGLAQSAYTLAKDAQARAIDAKAHAETMSEQLLDLLNSRSWRITKPLRSMATILRKILGK